jgi:hypothetical protein
VNTEHLSTVRRTAVDIPNLWRISMNIPNPLDAHNRRKVRRVAKEQGPHADRLFDLAAGGIEDWTYPAWKKVLDSLDSCEETVEQFRAIRELKT